MLITVHLFYYLSEGNTEYVRRLSFSRIKQSKVMRLRTLKYTPALNCPFYRTLLTQLSSVNSVDWPPLSSDSADLNAS